MVRTELGVRFTTPYHSSAFRVLPYMRELSDATYL